MLADFSIFVGGDLLVCYLDAHVPNVDRPSGFTCWPAWSVGGECG